MYKEGSLRIVVRIKKSMEHKWKDGALRLKSTKARHVPLNLVRHIKIIYVGSLGKYTKYQEVGISGSLGPKVGSSQ